MKFSIDTLLTSTIINEYAAQFDQIPMDFVKQCDNHFKGNESKQFYKGLLTGFANSQNLVRQVDSNSISANSLGMIVCYVSKKYLDL